MLLHRKSAKRKGSILNAPIKHLISASLAVALFVSFAPSALAVPTTQQQAETVKKEIDSLGHEIEVAAEAYNGSRERHDAIVVKRDEAASQVKQSEERIGELKANLSVRAASMYRTGQLSFLEVLLGAQSFEDFATLWDTLNQMNRSDAALVGELKVAREEYRAAKADLDVQETAAAAEVEKMAGQQRAIEAKLAVHQATLDGLQAEIAAEIAAARVREEAAAAAKTWKPASKVNIPAPTNRSRGEVVSVAMEYLGVPYVWGSSNPAVGFDCSGFTSYVYKRVGVSIPRTSRAQSTSGQAVGFSDLQPGDLVFFYSPVSHVGIYIGNGQYVHAPTTGDVVKVSSNFSSYSGARRP